jgi:hypothetical protein
MQISLQAVKRKLGIICFNFRMFGILASQAGGSSASAPSIRRLSIRRVLDASAEPRLGAHFVQFVGFGV